MNPVKIILGAFLLFCSNLSIAQNGTLKGTISNELSNEPIIFANVILEGTTKAAVSDVEGNYILEDIEPGTYNVLITSIGYNQKVISEVMIGSVNAKELNIKLESSVVSVNKVSIEAKPFRKKEESPLSLRKISATEIFRSPGGNRDISRVLQNLPGVSSSVSFRNDIIVRGGAPNENRFYLDGIEVPNINHFATQGSSGGPVGLINVNFISEVDFYSGAFPSARGNALSSVIEFTQIDGSSDKLGGTFAVGSSDAGLTLNGPIGEKTTFILSARRSYLQFLFETIGLPFLPTYNDMQFKTKTKINQKNELTFIGLGAIDDFELNTTVNENEEDAEQIDINNYILNNLPINNQWNYAVGANWKHYKDESFQNFVLSRNHLNNSAIKYQGNIETAENLLLDYQSEEIENKFRFENTSRIDQWKFNYGLGLENSLYTNDTYNKVQINGEVREIEYTSNLVVNKASLFGQISRTLMENRLTLSGGIRTDFNDYSKLMSNPLDQISPRVSASFALTEKLYFNANVGRYYQLPSYTILGYRDSENTLVNRDRVSYIGANHYVGGFEYNVNKYLNVSIESFYKTYDNYPFSLTDSISLANLGADFGVIGNDEINSNSQGRSYGLEFLIQQKLSSKVYGILSYTFVRSEFTDKNGSYIPSAWDNRHILNITAGRKFKNNWEIGGRFRLLGGAPYTPYDVALSSLTQVWDVTGSGILDYDQLNTERFPLTHGLDIRIDKKLFYKKWSLNLYLDIQNVYNFKSEVQPFLNVRTDENNNPIISEVDPSRYETYFIPNNSGTLLPSIGIMIDF